MIPYSGCEGTGERIGFARILAVLGTLLPSTSPTVVVGSMFWFVKPSVNSMWKFCWHARMIGSVEPASCGCEPFRK
jgi:hypothetical protein